MLVIVVILGLFSTLIHGFEPELEKAQTHLLERIREVHQLDKTQTANLRALLWGHAPPILSQGNPKVVKHPVSTEECLQKHEALKLNFRDDEAEAICGARYMAPVYARGKSAGDAPVCVDRFEFPNIPCEYPVTWATAREAAMACEAVGERLCDVNEWESACAGAYEEMDLGVSEYTHNSKREKIWATPQYFKGAKGVCGTGSAKSKGCDHAIQNGGDIWASCGANTYPSGFYTECKSSFGVYDQHGNAAEHMNLPKSKKQQGSQGGSGSTEMKGSWFVFDQTYAHEDDCRWRAPFWHGTQVMAGNSHQNYHLGFRCCKSTQF